jgi:hypothetical protein
VAIVDIASRHGQRHQAPGHQGPQHRRHGLDASDEDGGSNTNSGTPAIKIAPQPVKGLYLPDAIARYTVDGKSYLVTANEGDARADWPGFNEETRVRAHCSAGLDPTVFADADKLILDSNLGRLRITSTPNGGSTGKNASGQCNELYSFGARSFSIWDMNLNRVFDSGDEMEQRTRPCPTWPSTPATTTTRPTAAAHPRDRSPKAWSWPASVRKALCLHRPGACGWRDGLRHHHPRRAQPGDLPQHPHRQHRRPRPRGPELHPGGQSPNGKPLLIVGHEVSGTTTVMQINLRY